MAATAAHSGLGRYALMLAALIVLAVGVAWAGTAPLAVHTTASGLGIQTIRQGTGASPLLTDTVAVQYTGTLADGTVFDSSYGRGPAQFPVSGVIPGWTEALQLMKPGGKYRLTIPPELAYGDEGAGGVIPPGATLTFDIELLAIAPRGTATKP